MTTDERRQLEELRWGLECVNARCPHCEAPKPYRLTPKPGSKTRAGVWKCRKCRKQFTVTVGTAWRSTHLHMADVLARVEEALASDLDPWSSRDYAPAGMQVWPFQRAASDPLVARINALVPKAIPEYVREEVCQEVAVLILEGAVVSQEMVERCIKATFRRYPIMSNHRGFFALDAYVAGEASNPRFGDALVGLEGQAGARWLRRSNG